MKVDSICIGDLEENCYLIQNKDEYLLVDPGENLEAILKFIRGKNVIGILITHSHHDHVGSLDELVKRYHYPVYQFSNLKEGKISIGSFNVEVVFTPGHKEDCVCYYFRDEKIMFTGDFLFRGSIGRCDLEGGNELEMIQSIEKIKKYDDDIVIYPGHGEISILGYEKKYNYYLIGDNDEL